MRLGIMAKVLARPSIEEVAAAVRLANLDAVQLNLELAGVGELPAALDESICSRIRKAFTLYDVEISAVSGTFNAIHPDRDYRRECIRRVGILAAKCAVLGTRVITLCSGTRNPESMWRPHPENCRPDAWAEMVETMRALARSAEDHDVTVAVEPEVVNVIDTASKAEQLIREVGSTHLAVVMDPANYFYPETVDRMQDVLRDIFFHVGDHIAIAHAKDVQAPPAGGTDCVRSAAGTGVLDYSTYLRLLRESGYVGALIIHSLSEHELPMSRDYVRRHLRLAGLS